MIRFVHSFLFVLIFQLAVLPLRAEVQVPAPPELNARGYILVDHFSGQVLASKNENERLDPASITKL